MVAVMVVEIVVFFGGSVDEAAGPVAPHPVTTVKTTRTKPNAANRLIVRVTSSTFPASPYGFALLLSMLGVRLEHSDSKLARLMLHRLPSSANIH